MVFSSRNLRTSKMLKIETIARNFKIFWSLQVRTCVYAYRTLRAWDEDIREEDGVGDSNDGGRSGS